MRGLRLYIGLILEEFAEELLGGSTLLCEEELELLGDLATSGLVVEALQ